MSGRVSIALLGTGRIGHLHAQTLALLSEKCDLTTVVDVREDAAKATAEKLRVPNWSTSAEETIASPDIHAIVIATPTETHAHYIELAARHGTDVFTEKPIALDLASTDEALAAVKRAGTRLQVGFQRRFDSGYVAACEQIRAGSLGKIEMIRDVMRDPELAPRAYLERCGGLYRDMSIHNFDCVRWLMGAEPVELYAAGAALTDPMVAELNDIDTSIVTLTFANGALAVIDNSRRSAFGYDVRTEIFGSEGAAFVGQARQTPIEIYSAAGVCHDHIDWFIERFEKAYAAELASFIDAILADRPVAVTGEDGRAALAMAVAAERSRALHRPVRMDEIKGDTAP
jgi:myo-inositol 2-dehydrogenase/D-chiro-inositol 1-dehydrogenase